MIANQFNNYCYKKKITVIDNVSNIPLSLVTLFGCSSKLSLLPILQIYV